MATHPPGPIPRSAPTLVTGLRNISSETANRIIFDAEDVIHRLEPEATPLVTLTAGIKKRRMATQQRFDWFELDPYPSELVVSGAQTAGDTSLEVQTGTGSRAAGAWVYINRRTREVIRVTSVSTDTLTVVRGYGGYSDAMADGDVMEFVGTAFEDGTGFGTMKSIQSANLYNYTQIFRTQYGLTGRMQNTDLYGGNDLENQRKDQGILHKKLIEKAMFFGRRNTVTGSTGPITTTGGLESWITSNVWDLNGSEPNQRAVVEFLEYAMKYGKGGNIGGSGNATKYAFCSRRWLTIFESFAHDKIRWEYIGDKETGVGINVGRFVTSHGSLMLTPVNIFDGEHGGFMFIVDLNHVRYVYHQGRNTKLLTERQANDIDGYQEEYRTDCGLEVSLEASHALVKGLPTAYA